MAEEKKIDRRGKYSRQNFGHELAEQGDTGAFVRQAMVAWDLPAIDISDIQQVEQRAGEYFSYCTGHDTIPNKTALSAWLGINRSTLNSWERGEYRKTTHQQFAKKVDTMMEGVLVDLMLNNKVMPANGIFLLKNHNNYRDQIDIAPAAPNPLGDTPDREALEARIAAVVVEDE